MGSFALKTISIAIVIALIVGAGAGYMIGNSPVSSLMEEKDGLEAEYDSLYLAFQDLEAELNSTQLLLDAQQRINDTIVNKYLSRTEELIDLEAEIARLQAELGETP